MTKTLVVNTFFLPYFSAGQKSKMGLTRKNQDASRSAFLGSWRTAISNQKMPFSHGITPALNPKSSFHASRQHWAHLVITLGPPESSRILSPSQGQLISNINSICDLDSPCHVTSLIHMFWRKTDIFGVHHSVYRKKSVLFPPNPTNLVFPNFHMSQRPFQCISTLW